MACDLYCPNCGENLGKDKECSVMESCGTCGETRIYNEYGDEDYLEDGEREDFLKAKRLKKRRGGIIYFR